MRKPAQGTRNARFIAVRRRYALRPATGCAAEGVCLQPQCPLYMTLCGGVCQTKRARRSSLRRAAMLRMILRGTEGKLGALAFFRGFFETGELLADFGGACV